MRSFFTALQFLTRIHIVRQDGLTLEDFGRSVRCFPLVGLVLGTIAFLVGLFFVNFVGPSYVTAAVLVLLPIALTGALHCDGFMDAADGLFSGREKERVLEIMKDSRVGSFGAVAFGASLLFDFALVLDLGQAPTILLIAVFLAPVVGRAAMVLAVACFPYARPEGLGKMFHDLAGRGAALSAIVVSAAVAAPWGPGALLVLVLSLGCAWLFDRWAAGKLGGLTGDLYGATEKVTETCVLFLFWTLLHVPQAQFLLGGWRF